MWANTQRDGRPAEYRWHPLFNPAKFGWRPLIECHAVTLPRRETRWSLLGCCKLPDGSQPLVVLSSPYCGDMWRRYCCLISFFPIVDTCLSCKDIAWQICAMVHRWRFLWSPYGIGQTIIFSSCHLLYLARWKCRTQKKVAKNRHLGTIAQLCRAISLQLRQKNLLSFTCPHDMVNFGP